LSLFLIAIADGVFSIVSVYSPQATWGKYAIICFFMLAYGLGAGPIPLFFAAEKFAAPIRAGAVAISTAVNWVVAFGVIRICARHATVLSGWGAFLGFAGASIGGGVFGFFFVRNPDAQARHGQALHPVRDLFAPLPPTEQSHG
jgi:hypothetical protein